MQKIVLEFINSLRNKKYAKSSISAHHQDLRKFFRWLEVEEKAIADRKTLDLFRKLSQADIEDYIIFLAKFYKPRTLARHISTLKLFLSYMEIKGLIKTSPAHRLRFPEIIPEAPEMGSQLTLSKKMLMGES